MRRSVNYFLSLSGKNIKRSAIREILKQVQRPGMISFAGGLPAPETFPVDDLKKTAIEILEKNGSAALQYGTTEGDIILRRLIADRYNRQGLKVGPDNIIITTGSQQGLDLIGKIFIDRGDYVLCGLPSYLGGLNTFLSYGAKLRGIHLDDQGMNPDSLEENVSRLCNTGKKIKFIYCIPDFQNPAGITMPDSRRKEIITIAKNYDFLIVEDSPYRELRFEGEHQKLMYELDDSGRVITLGTFSKILAPGLRVGWMTGNQSILERIITAKQTADICTSSFNQKLIAAYIGKGLLDKNLHKTIDLYRERRNFMIKCLEKYMPEGTTWTHPQGGLFLFVTLPCNVDADCILEKALEKKVAFVSGSTFFCNNEGHNTLRLNFSYSGNSETEEGMRRLALVISEELAVKKIHATG